MYCKKEENQSKDAKALTKGKDTQKRDGHNRGPLKQSYYWESDKLMDYPLEELFGCNVLMVF